MSNVLDAPEQPANKTAGEAAANPTRTVVLLSLVIVAALVFLFTRGEGEEVAVATDGIAGSETPDVVEPATDTTIVVDGAAPAVPADDAVVGSEAPAPAEPTVEPTISPEIETVPLIPAEPETTPAAPTTTETTTAPTTTEPTTTTTESTTTTPSPELQAFVEFTCTEEGGCGVHTTDRASWAPQTNARLSITYTGPSEVVTMIGDEALAFDPGETRETFWPGGGFFLSVNNTPQGDHRFDLTWSGTVEEDLPTETPATTPEAEDDLSVDETAESQTITTAVEDADEVSFT